MARTLPAIIAFTLAATGAAWAQGTRPDNAGAGLTIPGASVGGPPLIGGAAAGITPGATPPPEGSTALGGGMTPEATLNPSSGVPGAANQPLQPGANSFSMGQAATRIRKQGFTNVTGLHKDDRGVWHGKAMHNGHPASVSLDYRGEVAGGQSGAAGREAGRTYQGETR